MKGDQEKSPVSAEDQDAPAPERPTTPDEEADMDIAQMDDPPQAEGSRDDVEDGGAGGGAGRHRAR